MISTETFWEQMGNFNNATWPVQIITTILAAVLIYLFFTRPSDKLNKWLKGFFAFTFLWNGIVYFLIFARNPISLFAGAPLFIISAILFILDISKNKIEFKPPSNKTFLIITLLWILLAFFYPILGMIFGRTYPKVCLPIAPCPLTMLAISLMSASVPKVDKRIYALLLIWAFFALPKCFGILGSYEDCVLFASGIYGAIMLIRGKEKKVNN